MKTKVLVTGGAGQLGNLVCESIAKAGFDPIAIDKLMHSTYESLPAFGMTVEADLCDYDRLLDLFKQQQFKAVVHCSRLNKTEESLQMPDFYYQNNLGGTLCVVKAMLATSVSVMIYPRSTAPEDTPLGRSFAMIEQLLKDSARAYPMQVDMMERNPEAITSRLIEIFGIQK